MVPLTWHVLGVYGQSGSVLLGGRSDNNGMLNLSMCISTSNGWDMATILTQQYKHTISLTVRVFTRCWYLDLLFFSMTRYYVGAKRQIAKSWHSQADSCSTMTYTVVSGVMRAVERGYLRCDLWPNEPRACTLNGVIGERETSRVHTELISCRHCDGKQSWWIFTDTSTNLFCAVKRTKHFCRLRRRRVSDSMGKWETCSWIIRDSWFEIPLFVAPASLYLLTSVINMYSL